MCGWSGLWLRFAIRRWEENLVFKGGTSLSKAYGVIRRFSEDVDLTYDIRAIAPDLVGDNREALPNSRSEQKRWSDEVRRPLPEWIARDVEPILDEALANERLAAGLRVEVEKVFIDYETAAGGYGYVAPSVMLEFGARSMARSDAPIQQSSAELLRRAADGNFRLTWNPLPDGWEPLQEWMDETLEWLDQSSRP